MENERHTAICLMSKCQGKWKDAELRVERETGFRHTKQSLSLWSRRQLNRNPEYVPNNFTVQKQKERKKSLSYFSNFFLC